MPYGSLELVEDVLKNAPELLPNEADYERMLARVAEILCSREYTKLKGRISKRTLFRRASHDEDLARARYLQTLRPPPAAA
jgi:hypothetical protein